MAKRKFLSLLMVLAMLLSLTVNVWAEGEDPTQNPDPTPVVDPTPVPPASAIMSV